MTGNPFGSISRQQDLTFKVIAYKVILRDSFVMHSLIDCFPMAIHIIKPEILSVSPRKEIEAQRV